MGWLRLWMLKRRISYEIRKLKVTDPYLPDDMAQAKARNRVYLSQTANVIPPDRILSDLPGGERDYLRNVYQSLIELSTRYWQRLRFYRTFKTTALVVGASVPVIASTTAPRWTLAVIEGFIQLTRYQEQAILDMRLYSSLLREYEDFLVQFESLASADRHQAFEHFEAQITKARKEADQGLIGVLQLASVGGQGQRSDAEGSRQSQQQAGSAS